MRAPRWPASRPSPASDDVDPASRTFDPSFTRPITMAPPSRPHRGSSDDIVRRGLTARAPPPPASGPTPPRRPPLTLEVRRRRRDRDRRQPGRPVRRDRVPRDLLPDLGRDRLAGLDAQQLRAHRGVGLPHARVAPRRRLSLPRLQCPEHRDAPRPPAGGLPADRSLRDQLPRLEPLRDRPDVRRALLRGRQLDLGRARPSATRSRAAAATTTTSTGSSRSARRSTCPSSPRSTSIARSIRISRSAGDASAAARGPMSGPGARATSSTTASTSDPCRRPST